MVSAELLGATFEGAFLQATDLSNAALWRAGGMPKTLATVNLSDFPDTWRPSWMDDQSEVHPWNEKTYLELQQTILELQQTIGSLAPGSLRDRALDRIRRLDCSNPDRALAPCDPALVTPSEALAWRKLLEGARAVGPAYAKALATEVKEIVCSDYDAVVALPILRALLPPGPASAGRFSVSILAGRLNETGSEAPALVDSILSKDCLVSSTLTDPDRAKLLLIKQAATKAGK